MPDRVESMTEPSASALHSTPHGPRGPRGDWVRRVRKSIEEYFVGIDPTFGTTLGPFGLLSMALYTRSPTSNYIFDEQEALLANPYVRSAAAPHTSIRWVDAFFRDFWGLRPDRSIGSYRPLPNLLWRTLWKLGARDHSAFVHHWVNVMLHGLNGTLVCVFAFALTRRRGLAWLSGAAFTACAVLTEAVSGVVGTADVLSGTGILLALHALRCSLPWMVPLTFLGSLFGLFSKETALSCVPLMPIAAFLSAPLLHPYAPRRWLRSLLALLAALAAFVMYVEIRKHVFPTPLAPELLAAGQSQHSLWARGFWKFMQWYAQPSLPKDPLNNPLVGASTPLRTAGALRVWFRGLTQLVLPTSLSGDYSAPQEPAPEHAVFFESVLGGLTMALPLALALSLGLRRRATNPHGYCTYHVPVLRLGLLWIVVAFFPVSNIPVLLPTVRAERFWYLPAIGWSLLVALAADALFRRARGRWVLFASTASVVSFFGLQCFAARRHANDYADDLAFWDATRRTSPRSAKAHLNYAVMKGARNDLPTRLESTRVALDLAPQWPMAHIYLGDTLCRLHRTAEAWEHYAHGLELAPNDLGLTALALQCLWDEQALAPDSPIRAELDVVSGRHPGTWVEYLGRDILKHGDTYQGVEPKYRPRGYNEGPKDDP